VVELTEILDFCKDKKIIIVGNSSRLLNHNYGSLIDSYDIVVRINRGYQESNLYSDMIGNKTTILSVGVKSAVAALCIVGKNNLAYVLSPIIWSEKLGLPNGYDVMVNDYNILKANANINKPSTGISTYNFFNNLNNFKRLDLIGFDFFESSIRAINQLGHTKVFDHDGSKESAFFEKVKDNDRTQLHVMKDNVILAPNNIPRISTSRKHIVKNYKAK
tara:strand:- start:297 stop:950 length:654 start_codon:yes stop_codon:yes gene_type:complete